MTPLDNAEKTEKILLFSGGIDSYVAWHYLGKPKTVYFDLNTPYSKAEIEVIKNLIPSTIVEKVIDFSTRQEGEHAFVPYRNLHLALLANKYADTIVIAGLKDDKVSDKNERVFRQFSYLMSDMMGRKIIVISPFWGMTKEDVVRWYIHDYCGNPVDLLNTISCYTPDKSTVYRDYCGQCPACFRKFVALKANGIHDLPFFNRELMVEYRDKAITGNFYIPERNQTILKVLKEYL
jgi:7-cyano-7-deazaguanine synthase in queuosine biosynthesis